MTYEVTYNMKQENKFPDKDYEYLYNKYWKNEEESPFCGYWAKIGECKSESKFMKIFCKASCNRCDDKV